VTADDLLSAWLARRADRAAKIDALRAEQRADREATMQQIATTLSEAAGTAIEWWDLAHLHFAIHTSGRDYIEITGGPSGYVVCDSRTEHRVPTKTLKAAALAVRGMK